MNNFLAERQAWVAGFVRLGSALLASLLLLSLPGAHAGPLLSVGLGVMLMVIIALRPGFQRRSLGGLVFIAALAVAAVAAAFPVLSGGAISADGLRLGAVLAAAGGLALHAAQVAGLAPMRGLEVMVALAIAPMILWGRPDLDQAVIVAASGLALVLAGLGVLRRQPAARELTLALCVLFGFALFDVGAFVDRSFYAISAPLIAHIVVWRRAKPV